MASESVPSSSYSSKKTLTQSLDLDDDEENFKASATSAVALPILVSEESPAAGLKRKGSWAAVDMSSASTVRPGRAPYIVCNEQRQAETIELLQSLAWERGGHIGFSGWFNYDIIAATRPKQALICDINPRMIQFYEVFQKILLSSANRVPFLEALQKHLLEEGEYYDNGHLFELSGELAREGGWLSTDEGFEMVKGLHQSGKVRYRDLNAAADLSEFTAVEQDYAVPQRTTVYSSNIYEWLETADVEARERFLKNMGCLLKRGGAYIDAFYPTVARNGMVKKTGSGPPLRITMDELPSFIRIKELAKARVVS